VFPIGNWKLKIGNQTMPHETERFQIADRLHSAAIHLLRRVRKRDTETGEGPARLSALSVLVFGGPMTLGQLAQAEQVKPPTMTRIVAGLEKSGLAERETDANDARRIRIHATAKGKKLLMRGRQARIEYLASHLQELNSEEMSALLDAVEILERVLQNWK
jgi:DNA-binding MarR family transcriptional regulator